MPPMMILNYNLSTTWENICIQVSQLTISNNNRYDVIWCDEKWEEKNHKCNELNYKAFHQSPDLKENRTLPTKVWNKQSKSREMLKNKKKILAQEE